MPTNSKPSRLFFLRSISSLGRHPTTYIITIIVLLLAAAVAQRDENRRPTFIDGLQRAAINDKHIKSVEVLRFDPGAGWPMSEADYARKARKSVALEQVVELCRILSGPSTTPPSHRNHPRSCYFGIIRVELIQGGHYYLFFELLHSDGAYYVSIAGNPLNDPNPNNRTGFENAQLAAFLKANDPWFRDLGSPASQERPSFPDSPR